MPSKYSLSLELLRAYLKEPPWDVDLLNRKIFPVAAVGLLEEVFQVKFLEKLQEERGFVQVMVLAVREGSRGPMSPGLSPSGCCGSLHQPGG